MAATQITSSHIWGRMRSQSLILWRDQDLAALHSIRSPQAEEIILLLVCFASSSTDCPSSELSCQAKGSKETGVGRVSDRGGPGLGHPEAVLPVRLVYFPSRAPAASQP